MMIFCVIGLGYVGTVTAACFASLGHDVLAWDSNPERNEALREGRCPVPEPELEELLVKALTTGTLHVADSFSIPEHDLFFICVGTPLQDDHLNHDQIAKALTELYSLSSRQGLMKIAIIRSTINIQFMEQLARDLGREYPRAKVEIVLNPEFLREGSAVADFLDPPFVVVGGAGEPLETVLAAFAGIHCRKFKVSARSAAVLKLACNAFHATKVAFTNDVAMACDLVGADAGEVFAVFREDRALNCSARYLRPGFAFGGSCLPKDLRELVGILEANGCNSPLLSGVLESNERVIAAACDGILAEGVTRAALAGITFKPGTGDLRESPYLKLVELLVARGVSLAIHDPDLSPGGEAELLSRLGASIRICSTPAEALAGAEALLIAKLSPELQEAMGSVDPPLVFDLERLLPSPSALGENSAA